MKTINIISLILALITTVTFTACKDQNCTLAAREPKGDWQFVTAYPSRVITPPSGGNVGIAGVTCLYKRPVLFWFNCCGKYFPVSGTEWGVAETDPVAGQLPVNNIGMPLPVKGALGQAADLLGVSLDIATWFTDQKAADALCLGAGPINHKADEVTVPSCNNKYIKLPWHQWQISDALENLPERAIPVN